MGLTGKQAPEFVAAAVQNNKVIDNFSLKDFEGSKYVLFFFYPLDFTFVCPTELHAFQEQLEAFEKRDVQVVGCSVDSAFCHQAWLNVERREGGIKGITYPLVADITKSIAKDFDVLLEEDGVAYRGLFLIDKEGIIRHQIVNDLPLGRSVDEALRMCDALIHFEQAGEVCPANWSEGDKAMKPTQEALKAYSSSCVLDS